MARNRSARRTSEKIATCCICGEERHLTFEHVPPQKAFNAHRAKVSTMGDWLERDQNGGNIKGQIVQGGSGRFALCADCNNFTGSKYAAEYVEWARVAAAYLRRFEPMAQFAQQQFSIRTGSFGIGGVYPLRMAKQMVAMMMATSGPGLSTANPELRDFVLDEKLVGLSPKYRLYLSLFNDRKSRSSGVTGSVNVRTGGTTVGCEIAHFPFACALTLDEPEPLFPVGDVTQFVFNAYEAQASVVLKLLVGFCNTPFPNDLRTKYRVDFDAAVSDGLAALS